MGLVKAIRFAHSTEQVYFTKQFNYCTWNWSSAIKKLQYTDQNQYANLLLMQFAELVMMGIRNATTKTQYIVTGMCGLVVQWRIDV